MNSKNVVSQGLTKRIFPQNSSWNIRHFFSLHWMVDFNLSKAMLNPNCTWSIVNEHYTWCRSKGEKNGLQLGLFRISVAIRGYIREHRQLSGVLGDIPEVCFRTFVGSLLKINTSQYTWKLFFAIFATQDAWILREKIRFSLRFKTSWNLGENKVQH